MFNADKILGQLMGNPAAAEAAYSEILKDESSKARVAEDRAIWQAYLSRCVVRQDLGNYDLALGDCVVALQGSRNSDSLYFAAREPGRYAMHGVLAEVEGDQLKLVATDGRRLALSSVPVDARETNGKKAIVPTKGMQLFCRVMSDALDSVKLHLAEGQIGVRTRNAPS